MEDQRRDLRQVCYEHSQRIAELQRTCEMVKSSLAGLTKEIDDVTHEVWGNDGEGGLTKGLRAVQTEIHDAKVWIKAMSLMLFLLAIISGSVNGEKLLKLFVK